MSIEIPFDPDQHRIDALTEGSGRSTFSATEQVKGTGDILGSSELPLALTKRRRVRRPLGRAAAEVSGRDVSRMIAQQEAAEHPMTPEESAASRRSEGHIAFLLEKERLAYEHAVAKADSDPVQLAILLRKLADDKK